MSSTAYHWSPRLVETGDGVEVVDPWLDDKTTIPYRRGAAHSSNLPESTPPAAATSTRPAYFSPPARINAPVPLSSGSATPRQRTAAAAQAQPVGPVSSVRHMTTMKVERLPARPGKARKRHATTMKVERLPVRLAMTSDPFSQHADESYWRAQHKAMRAPSARRMWIGAAVCAALLVVVMLRLFGPELLPRLPWQNAQRTSLADLLTHQHAATTSLAAPSGMLPSHVIVTAPESERLAQPATLRIDSQPWARVIVDDVLIGNTPQLAIKLQPGKHFVRLLNPERSLQKDIPLEAHPGETIHRIEQLER
jgi:hypothetical protein